MGSLGLFGGVVLRCCRMDGLREHLSVPSHGQGLERCRGACPGLRRCSFGSGGLRCACRAVPSSREQEPTRGAGDVARHGDCSAWSLELWWHGGLAAWWWCCCCCCCCWVHVPPRRGTFSPLFFVSCLQVKIMTEKELLAVACEQFLGKNVQDVKNVVLQTLEGHLRSILGAEGLSQP